MSLNTKTQPHTDECRYLILKIVEQAVRDFLSLSHSNAPVEQKYYETACRFLFDDEYSIDYGGVDKTLHNLLDILDYDISWFRERVVKLKDQSIRGLLKKRIEDEVLCMYEQEEASGFEDDGD